MLIYVYFYIGAKALYLKDLQTKLIELTKRNISQTDIANALNVTRSNISLRIKNDSPLNTEEIKKIEEYFNVTLLAYNPVLETSLSAKVKKLAKWVYRDKLKKYNNNFETFKQKHPRIIKDLENALAPTGEVMSSSEDCLTIEYIGISPSCGTGAIVIDEPEIRNIKLSNDLITNILKCSHPENLKVFKAQGDSMETLIEDGDLLLVDTGRTDIYNAGIYVFSVDSEWRVKRFRLRIDKVLEIISDNPKYDIELIEPDRDINIIIRGKVIKNLSRGL